MGLQGGIGDQFYIIKEGEAVVTQKAPEGDKRINMLFKADFFGERALLTEEPRCPPPSLRSPHTLQPPLVISTAGYIRYYSGIDC